MSLIKSYNTNYVLAGLQCDYGVNFLRWDQSLTHYWIMLQSDMQSIPIGTNFIWRVTSFQNCFLLALKQKLFRLALNYLHF